MGELSHQKYRCSLFVLQSKKALAKGGCFSDQFKKLTHYHMNRRRWQVVTMKESWASGNKKPSRLKARKKIGDMSIQQLAL